MMAASPATSRTPYSDAIRSLRRSFLHAGIFSAVINVLMLVGPLYMLQIYDRVLTSGSVPTLIGLFVIVLVLYAFMGVYEFIRSLILSRAAYRFDTMTGELAFANLLRENTQAKADPASALRDVEIVRSFLSGAAIRGLFDAPWIPIFLVAVFFIHPWLGYLTLAGAAVVATVALANQRVTQNTVAQGLQLDAAERSFTNQSQLNTESIQALGMRAAITSRWRGMHRAALSESQYSGDWSAGFSAFSRTFRLLLQSMLLTAGAYLALNQQISAGMIVGASILSGRALAPVDQVIGQWRGIGRAVEAHKRLRATLDDVPLQKPRISLPDPTGALRLRTVTKLVPGTSQKGRPRILTQVSFDLEPGDILGVLGNSAAGKSSLARLLVGIWQPDLGEVRLDGATLDQWEPDELGRRIGYLPQHVDMLPGSIAENIARFDSDAQEADIIAAARAADVHDMILRLPDGYATRVGGAAQPLSGGQIQRIGLARAVFRFPKFIVLDEPNAHLDTHGDEALTTTIRHLREKCCTVVVMAHRPSVIAETSKVLILHNGQVAKFGSREEIMRLAMHSVPDTGQEAVL